MFSPLSVPLTQIYNQWIETGIVPNILKVSQVTPVSTEQAVLEITDSRKKAMDKKLVTCGIFLDFSKAFDTINHDILVSKLYRYGIRGNPLRWFENYLYNRNQVVKIGDTISSSQTIICGIPQGSTLGPLLFLLYINDLPICSSKLSFRIFADDTNMFYTSNNLHNLESVMNEEFKSVVKYCAINKLSINFSKTNYILVSSSSLSGSINVYNIKIKS